MLHAVLLYVLRFVQKAANQCPSEMEFRSLSKRSHDWGQILPQIPIQGICRVICCKKITLHRIPLVPSLLCIACFVWHCLVPDYDHCFTLTWTWSCWSSKHLPLLWHPCAYPKPLRCTFQNKKWGKKSVPNTTIAKPTLQMARREFLGSWVPVGHCEKCQWFGLVN